MQMPNMDAKPRQMTTQLVDDKMVLTFAGGDPIAIEAKYHKDCYTNYFNKYW